jgi:hypothetical protein
VVFYLNQQDNVGLATPFNFSRDAIFPLAPVLSPSLPRGVLESVSSQQKKKKWGKSHFLGSLKTPENRFPYVSFFTFLQPVFSMGDLLGLP